MLLFFKVVGMIRAAYKAIRAAAGIMIVAHATYKWAQVHRTKAA
jgi:hypothetical protein